MEAANHVQLGEDVRLGFRGSGFGTRKPPLNFKEIISVVCWRQKPDLPLEWKCHTGRISI